MLKLNKDKVAKHFKMDAKAYASVCNSCACGGGNATCNTTCKGCKDIGQNVSKAKDVYAK